MTILHTLRNCFETEIIAALVTTSSVIGLLQLCDISHSYPTDDLKQAFLPNDAVNLILGVPMLLASAYDSYLLLGALLYHAYSSLTYVLALEDMQFGCIFSLQSAILVGCCLGLPDAYAAALEKATHDRRTSMIPKDNKTPRSNSSVSEKVGGVFLLLWGSLFMTRSLYLLLRNLNDEGAAALEASERGVDMADIIIGATWIFGGNQLFWRSNVALGQALLFQGSMLFLALILILTIKPWVVSQQAGTLEVLDILVVGGMGLTVLIPFFFINRGLRNSESNKFLRT